MLAGCTEKLTNFDDTKVKIAINSVSKSDLEGEIYTIKITNQTEVKLNTLALYLQFPSKREPNNELDGYRIVGEIGYSNILQELPISESAEFQVRIPRNEGFLDKFSIETENPLLILNGFVGKEDFSITTHLDELID